jgi:periplasmic protein TonB
VVRVTLLGTGNGASGAKGGTEAGGEAGREASSPSPASIEPTPALPESSLAPKAAEAPVRSMRPTPTSLSPSPPRHKVKPPHPTPARVREPASAPQPQPAEIVSAAPQPEPVPGTRGIGSGPGGEAGRGQGAEGAGLGAIGTGPINGPGDDYLERLRRWLNQYKRYPEEAQKAKQEGELVLDFIILRDGTVVSPRIEQSSGFPLLDQAALDMLAAASPVPPLPAAYGADRAEIALPVDYSIGFLRRVF